MTEEIPVVGLREPCPCGSGKRYKACHGKARNRESVAHARRDGCLYVGGTVVLCEIAQPTWAHTSARAAGKAAKLSRRYP